MQTKNWLIILLTSFSMAMPLALKAQTHGDLTVIISGLRNNNGKVGITLFNKEEGFPSSEKAAFKHTSKTPFNKSAVITFENLTPGTYAVGILHDENNNSEMDYNFFGIPTEGYGISNNPKLLLKPPTFDQAKFIVKAGKNVITIHAKYM